MLVQSNPLKPSSSAAFAAFLNGLRLGVPVEVSCMPCRYIASPDYFLTFGASGMMVPYKRLT